MMDEELDVVVTDANVKEVAKASGRPLEALKRHLKLAQDRQQTMHVRLPRVR